MEGLDQNAIRPALNPLHCRFGFKLRNLGVLFGDERIKFIVRIVVLERASPEVRGWIFVRLCGCFANTAREILLGKTKCLCNGTLGGILLAKLLDLRIVVPIVLAETEVELRDLFDFTLKIAVEDNRESARRLKLAGWCD